MSVAKAAKVLSCASHRLYSANVKIDLRCHQDVVQNCAHNPCDLLMRFACCLCQACFLLVHVVSCSGQGDVWSIKRLAGQACRTSLLVHVSTKDHTCCCHTTQRHDHDIASYVLEVKLSSPFAIGLCVGE